MVDHIEFLVEGASMKEALNLLLPGILPDDVGFEVFDLGSKSQFLKKWPNRMRGYATWLPHVNRAVVGVIDADQDDCRGLRNELADAAREAGLTVCSPSGNRRGQVLPRIAVEMLEAWYFGDVAALAAAYGPSLARLGIGSGCRRPDEIRDPARRLGGLLKGKHGAGLNKIQLARDVAGQMDIDRNTSPSFCRLRDGVRFLTTDQENHASSN